MAQHLAADQTNVGDAVRRGQSYEASQKTNERAGKSWRYATQRAGGNSGNGATPFEFPYARNTSTASSGAVYAMRACEKCGLHVPENEGSWSAVNSTVVKNTHNERAQRTHH